GRALRRRLRDARQDVTVGLRTVLARHHVGYAFLARPLLCDTARVGLTGDRPGLGLWLVLAFGLGCISVGLDWSRSLLDRGFWFAHLSAIALHRLLPIGLRDSWDKHCGEDGEDPHRRQGGDEPHDAASASSRSISLASPTRFRGFFGAIGRFRGH